MALNLEQTEGVSINGLFLKKVVTTQGKKEDDPGTVEITLTSKKDEVHTGAYTLGDVMAALNSHQEGKHPITIKVLMPTNVRPDMTRVQSGQAELAAQQTK
jgi:hypothetical protein